jgi:eukaryotic-like serine/threonine-protein kinase
LRKVRSARSAQTIGDRSDAPRRQLANDAKVLSGAVTELEVERSVRARLYGERRAVTATRTLCAGGPLGCLVGGRYRLLELVGEGGMATVYRARDEQLKRDVAVKAIRTSRARDPLFVRRLRREAELCARLAHPNIVAILDAGVGPPEFTVMEFVHGLDAGGLLRRRGRLTPGQTVHVVAQVCEALTHAHDRDVVHQDVSLRNILIGHRDDTAKLADFGLASDALDVPDRRLAVVTGTPGCVAPEVLCGARPSPRSDLYSLGVVAHRLLTGPSRVRTSDPDPTAPMATAAPRIPPLGEARPDLSRGLIAAVQQALAHDPDVRQDSVAEFRAQLVDGLAPSFRLQRSNPLLPAAARGELSSAA